MEIILFKKREDSPLMRLKKQMLKRVMQLAWYFIKKESLCMSDALKKGWKHYIYEINNSKKNTKTQLLLF